MNKRILAGIGVLGLFAGVASAVTFDLSPKATNPNHGQNPNLGSGSGERPGRPPSNVPFEPKYVNVVYLRFSSNGTFKADHAFFKSSGRESPKPGQPTPKRDADLALAAHQIAYFKNNEESWDGAIDFSNMEQCATPKVQNFSCYKFFDQTRIFMYVDNPNLPSGPTWTFHDKWPILFTEFGANDRTKGLLRNYSFFNAETIDNNTGDDPQGQNNINDDFLYMENYFTHDHGAFSSNRRLKPRNPQRQGKTYEYSFNIHLVQKDPGRPSIPIIIDPDTGNGTDE